MKNLFISAALLSVSFFTGCKEEQPKPKLSYCEKQVITNKQKNLYIKVVSTNGDTLLTTNDTVNVYNRVYNSRTKPIMQFIECDLQRPRNVEMKEIEGKYVYFADLEFKF